MRCHSLCAVGGTGKGQHLPLPDVPEGGRRAVRVVRRHRKRRLRLDPGQARGVPLLSIAERDFCRDCGTPLSFRRIDGPRIEIMTGAFDRPDRVVPIQQFGTESRLGWVVAIANLPSQTTLQNYGADKVGGIVSHQHPDHD
jgi:hypothetical protein